ncbi:NAD(P)/FAD-dependent oxidoreductase [Hymenobacter sp. DH14]|uniref:NAD(P)/FAD-dependent oxidoreductase n=1 Tax=Hymenobacter cyanobacteriorum TaxID=2926463 RepID=A0A9X1VDP3_9BACT|nr:NAD(P)/FAD-dependent oxidoreductase [Hymenobacter cyanobacteriorum]MCI1186688.1 NAD(P)/FAD-dependent oxidoreductase [Hymenobacter cyanobacteriorum]
MALPLPVAAAFPPIVLDAVVIGAGQAGLAAAYYLRKRGVNFRILEAAPNVGAAWAARYDSLQLFSPAWASGLPGRPWPGSPLRYPTRDETVAYLRDYAAHFSFPIDTGQRVTRLVPAPGQPGYAVHTAAGRTYLARYVIIATGPYVQPNVPIWASQLAAGMVQLHSRDYQRPAQLPGTGPVAVVGSGNSALQIAADLAATGRPVFAAYDERTNAAPNNQLIWAGMTLTGFLRVPRHTALGRWLHSKPDGVVSGDLDHLRSFANVTFIGRATGVLPGGIIRGEKAATPPLEAVVWATGYRPHYPWIELPILAPDGSPQHQRGLTAAPGVAFLGLSWLDTRSSALLNGAGADARRVVAALLAGQ